MQRWYAIKAIAKSSTHSLSLLVIDQVPALPAGLLVLRQGCIVHAAATRRARESKCNVRAPTAQCLRQQATSELRSLGHPRRPKEACYLELISRVLTSASEIAISAPRRKRLRTTPIASSTRAQCELCGVFERVEEGNAHRRAIGNKAKHGIQRSSLHYILDTGCCWLRTSARPDPLSLRPTPPPSLPSRPPSALNECRA